MPGQMGFQSLVDTTKLETAGAALRRTSEPRDLNLMVEGRA